MLFTIRFMALLLRPSRSCAAMAVAVVGLGAYLLETDPQHIDQALILGLFFQMFMASTGYRQSLSRGHFDSLLVEDRGAWTLAAAHFLASAWPGFLVWLALAALTSAARQTFPPAELTRAGLAVWLYVSAASWAVALITVRFAGGIVWLAGLFWAASTHYLGSLRELFHTTPDGWTSLLYAWIAAWICPLFPLVDARQVSGSVVGGVAGAALASIVVGVVVINRCDTALREPA